ncbi:MAG: class I SAM-dependent methyltransferase [Acidimicrobiales bacterium]
MRQGPAGDFDYERFGHRYSAHRRTDPRIAAQVQAQLGSGHTVLNVGAGAGSYEPADRAVVAVEPSAQMRSQRPAGLAPAIDARAEELPFGDRVFDAAMATVTIHQWSDPVAGLAEMRRVTSGPVVVLTFDGDDLDQFWLAQYAPELIEAERRRYPSIDTVCSLLGWTSVETVPVPFDCTDGFTEAYYGRPERFLEHEVRRSQSAWGFVDTETESRSVERLARDLASGEWDRRHGHLRGQERYLGSLRLVVGRPANAPEGPPTLSPPARRHPLG